MKPARSYPMTMIHLLRAVYWYDEALQSNLRRDGWPTPTRTQSMLFANIAMGETRPARLAANLGITRQSMSQLIATMVERNILVAEPDPHDRRAQKITFHPDSAPLRHAAEMVMTGLHEHLGTRLGEDRLSALDDAISMDWGPIPDLRPLERK
ncbi:helix-turn-helix domain-containing protein [Sphingopyxis sp.]|uniref:MarR family winged helix-turn-helix transcriptional regulator n=1 Tax=Sphingopyxis sp. TaxID=1908224 RepID=UPI002EDB5821